MSTPNFALASRDRVPVIEQIRFIAACALLSETLSLTLPSTVAHSGGAFSWQSLSLQLHAQRASSWNPGVGDDDYLPRKSTPLPVPWIPPWDGSDPTWEAQESEEGHRERSEKCSFDAHNFREQEAPCGAPRRRRGQELSTDVGEECPEGCTSPESVRFETFHAPEATEQTSAAAAATMSPGMLLPPPKEATSTTQGARARLRQVSKESAKVLCCWRRLTCVCSCPCGASGPVADSRMLRGYLMRIFNTSPRPIVVSFATML